MVVRKLGVLLCVGLMGLLSFAAWGDDATVAYRSDITFSGYAGSETLTDFPALIRLPDGVPGFAYAQCASDGSDIYFVDADGKTLAAEIDTWDNSSETATSLIWVRVPSLTKTTKIMMCWGNAGKATAAKAAAQTSKVWNDDYMTVHHFSELYNAPAESDSSNNRGCFYDSAQATTNNATIYDTTATASGTHTFHESAFLGKGYHTTSSGAQKSVVGSRLVFESVDDGAGWKQFLTTKQLTVSFWMKAAKATADMRLVSTKYNWSDATGFEITTRSTDGKSWTVGGQGSTQYKPAGTVSYNGSWVYATAVYDGTLETPAVTLYVNGSLVGSASDSNYYLKTTPANVLTFCCSANNNYQYFNGWIDEVRTSKTAVSADWQKADYDTMNTPAKFAVSLCAGEFSYCLDGTTLTVYGGTLLAADLTDCTTLVKEGASTTVNASAATEFKNVTLTAGALSFVDGTATARTVEGTLSLAGGTRLDVDLTTAAADSLTAATIDLSSASAANPVTIAVHTSGVASSTPRVLLTVADGLAEEDLAKFKLESDSPRVLAIVDGALTVVDRPPAGYTLVDYIESTGVQYIDTDYIHTANTRVVCVVNASAKQPGPWPAVFGSRKNTMAANAFCFFVKSGNTGSVSVYSRTGYEDTGDSMPTEKKVTLTCEGQTASWYEVDTPANTGTITTTGTADAGLGSLFIFSLNYSSEAGGKLLKEAALSLMKLYSFKIYEGTELKQDLVPCVSPSGSAGVYDLVKGAFLGNSGTGRFYLPGDPPELLFARGWLENSTTTDNAWQYVDTGYQPTTATHIETSVHLYPQTASWSVLFGEAKNSNGDNGVAVRYRSALSAKNNKVNSFFCCSDSSAQELAMTPDADYVIDLKSGSFTFGTETAEFTSSGSPYSPRTLYLFCWNTGSANRYQQTRFYDFKISEGDTVKLDLIPARKQDGNEISFYDKANGNHLENKGKYAFVSYSAPLSYWPTADGDSKKITVYDGTLLAEDLTGYTALEKAGLLAVDAAAVTAFPPLTLSGGVLSFTDAGGTATARTVDGTLTLAGGTRLEIDVTADGADSLTATAIDLSSVRADQPVTLAVTAGCTASATERVLLKGGLVADDLAKFKLESETSLELAISDGALVIAAPAIATAFWRGTTDGDPAKAANWVCYDSEGQEVANGLPTAETPIHVDAASTLNLQAPAASTFAYKTFAVDAPATGTTQTLTLAADLDWRRFGDVAIPDGTTIDLNGHKLYVSSLTVTTDKQVAVTDTQGGGELHFSKDSYQYYDKIGLDEKVTLVFEGDGYSSFHFMKSMTAGTLAISNAWLMITLSAIDSKTANLRMLAGGKFNLVKNLSVYDYYAGSSATSVSGSGQIYVYGTFTPVVDCFRACTLQNGATLDLASRSGTWSTQSNLSSYNTATFADGATISVNVAGRTDLATLARSSSPYLINWSTRAPADSVTFNMVGLRTGYSVEKDATGLKLAVDESLVVKGAEVGGTQYETVELAVAAANGQTVRILANTLQLNLTTTNDSEKGPLVTITAVFVDNTYTPPAGTTYLLQMSTDEGVTWSAVGSAQTDQTFTVAQPAGGQAVRYRVKLILP